MCQRSESDEMVTPTIYKARESGKALTPGSGSDRIRQDALRISINLNLILPAAEHRVGSKPSYRSDSLRAERRARGVMAGGARSTDPITFV